MKIKKFTKFDDLYYSVKEEIETYNDKPNPPGGNNITHTDAGSITGNQCKYMNNQPTTDIGSITGNQSKYSTDPGSITGNCTGQSNTNSTVTQQAECGGEAAITTTSTFGPATPADSLANFCTANQQNLPKHDDTPGINTSDIKQIYSPALPYKKAKMKKISRKYPLFSRFK